VHEPVCVSARVGAGALGGRRGREDGLEEAVPHRQMRALLEGVRVQRVAPLGRCALGRLARDVGDGDHGVAVLVGVSLQLLRAELPAVPAQVEGVLENVAGASGVVQRGDDVHGSPSGRGSVCGFLRS
jgi:hypothetical protein